MKYHKINSIFKRDMTKPNRPFVVGEWAQPEFAYLSDNEWEWTEKIDGTNIRIMLDGDEVEFVEREEAEVYLSLEVLEKDSILDLMTRVE